VTVKYDYLHETRPSIQSAVLSVLLLGRSTE
jgi:hypothetical protein